MEKQDLLRKLPSVDEVLGWHEMGTFLRSFSRELVADGIRSALDNVRQEILQALDEEVETKAKLITALKNFIIENVRKYTSYHLKPVINATGVVIHTNLGRSPLAPEALERVIEISKGYSNLEYDLEEGKRGSRYSHVEYLLKKLCQAEDAFVVNNNASAVLLALNTLARDREVIVSRGEMIEIGGSFRIPEIMKISGARLVEVGTTNKTHLKDYEDAITEDTALILKVHPSNYRVVGFTREVSLEELSELGNRKNIPVMYDAGSGALIDFSEKGFAGEPTISVALKSGVDFVTFSGDKLLGGPQAGIIVGAKSYIERMKKNHLNRALRIDKLTLAALEATLRLYLEGDPWVLIPTLRLLSESKEKLKKRSLAFSRKLRKEFGNKVDPQVVTTEARSGGGALPEIRIPSSGVSVAFKNFEPQEVEKALRHSEPPVIVLVQNDRVLFDMRTIFPGEEKGIISALKEIGV